jgi:hypothetical protein
MSLRVYLCINIFIHSRRDGQFIGMDRQSTCMFSINLYILDSEFDSRDRSLIDH